MNKYYVYGHYFKDTDELFYIGKGCNDRVSCRSGRSKIWQQTTKDKPWYGKILSDNLNITDALDLENLLINSNTGLINVTRTRYKKLTCSEYSAYFKYNPEAPSGLERIKGTWNKTHYQGKIGFIGHLRRYKGREYWGVKFKSKSIAVHLIIWTLFNGDIPEGSIIDHVDRDSTNNLIENLRCVTAEVNARNKNKSCRNTSGHTGVYWFNETSSCGYRAVYSIGSRKYTQRFYIHRHGLLPAFALAVQWRQQKIKELNEQGAGYSDRHGT